MNRSKVSKALLLKQKIDKFEIDLKRKYLQGNFQTKKRNEILICRFMSNFWKEPEEKDFQEFEEFLNLQPALKKFKVKLEKEKRRKELIKELLD